LIVFIYIYEINDEASKKKKGNNKNNNKIDDLKAKKGVLGTDMRAWGTRRRRRGKECRRSVDVRDA
jgi:hypothetical protein